MLSVLVYYFLGTQLRYCHGLILVKFNSVMLLKFDVSLVLMKYSLSINKSIIVLEDINYLYFFVFFI